MSRLRCPRCSTTVPAAEFMYGCPTCAAEGVPVNVHPHGPTGAWRIDESAPGIFRWRHMLPIPTDATVVSLGEGRTPLLPLERTARRAGLGTLLVKDESRNPTWSYKDRLAAVAVTRARADGADTVVVATTGNHGAAAAAYAAAAGMRCVALTLASVPLTMKVLMQAYGAEVVAVEHPPDRWSLMREAVEEWGWIPLSGLMDPPIGSNPFGVDGYKTIAYEIHADLGETPDAVIVPTAYADGLTGIHRGFQDLVAVGLAERTPRMIAVEPLGPLAASLRSGGDVPARIAGRASVAFSIAGTVATHQGMATIRSSGGSAVIVDHDEDIMRTQLRVAAEEGIYLEASAVIGVAAVDRLRHDGDLDPDDVVVIIGTSTGLKDIDSTSARLPDVPVIEPTLTALEEQLGG